MIKIDDFRREYYFLSNFFERAVTYDGLAYDNNEDAFQAAKVFGEARNQFKHLKPGDAKRLGFKVALRPDWETEKDRIMYEICLAKFRQNPDLAERLIATGNAELIEGNTWNDKYWGVCYGKGQNKLGKILMRIREELQ